MYAGRAVARRGTVVALPEDIALVNATPIAEQLTLAVSHGSTAIIDMTATTFCDCAGARAIVPAHKRATGSGAELRLVIAAEPVRAYRACSGSIVCLTPTPMWRQRGRGRT